MKRSIFCLVLFLSAAMSLHAQTAPDAAKLTALLNEFLAGAGRNDAAVHDRFWADDLIYTRSAGSRTNKDEDMKGLRTATPPKPGDLVITTTKNDGSKTVGNNLNTGTFIRRKGKWQAVAWQSTVVPKQ